jgi:hypothetical protein
MSWSSLCCLLFSFVSQEKSGSFDPVEAFYRADGHAGGKAKTIISPLSYRGNVTMTSTTKRNGPSSIIVMSTIFRFFVNVSKNKKTSVSSVPRTDRSQ